MYSKADLSNQKWNCPVSCSKHSYFGTDPFEGGGGRGRVLRVKVFSFACWSTQGAILISQSFHLLMDPGYRASPASHTKRSVSAGTWYGAFFFFLFSLFFSGGSGHGVKISLTASLVGLLDTKQTNIIHAHCIMISLSESTSFKMWLFCRVQRIVNLSKDVWKAYLFREVCLYMFLGELEQLIPQHSP